mmetsp:Transcript_45340/g.91476  ORF Transcript_45340/g.91476 Transcript_45340/m.91476 type:complete len:216 (-) Transcript_45340:1646-2293(-)
MFTPRLPVSRPRSPSGVIVVGSTSSTFIIKKVPSLCCGPIAFLGPDFCVFPIAAISYSKNQARSERTFELALLRQFPVLPGGVCFRRSPKVCDHVGLVPAMVTLHFEYQSSRGILEDALVSKVPKRCWVGHVLKRVLQNQFRCGHAEWGFTALFKLHRENCTQSRLQGCRNRRVFIRFHFATPMALFEFDDLVQPTAANNVKKFQRSGTMADGIQ